MSDTNEDKAMNEDTNSAADSVDHNSDSVNETKVFDSVPIAEPDDNAVNSLKNVTLEQLDGVFTGDSGNSTNVSSTQNNTEVVPEVSPVLPTKVELDTKQLEEERDTAIKQARRGTQSLGLLVIRLLLGVLLLHDGYNKLFTNGGLDATKNLVSSAGFKHEDILGIVYGVLQFGCGIFLILGLATPLIASLAAGIALLEYLSDQAAVVGIQFFSGETGSYLFEYRYVIFFLAVGIVLTGPGSISLDMGRKWTKRPFIGSILMLLCALLFAVAVWIVFNGSNVFY